jgi:hypothetical protein
MKDLEKRQKAIDEIMDNFDFHKCQEYMKSVNWRYMDDEEPPTIGVLRKTAYGLLSNVKDGSTNRIGGFIATRTSDEYELYFSISNWYSSF